ncbi:Protein AIG1 [Dendrobium catenatum]|uniref:Protein AIG1 n=1 Tax=Dendrobium catenatum TaxID=906689 RepID=A0A2I0X6Z0_9ASPA|nr:Protein AIG1 [Dendrobium catenatum]
MEADPITDWKLNTTRNIINLVIVGRTGNGKSATGNSILGREAFDSEYSLSAVTCSSELKKLMHKGGRTVNIIDTPGLFNFSTSAEEICGEIVKCISLAKDGIHAVLMVFSLRSQFSIEEVAAFESMKSLFGEKIVDYMIIIFTYGDILESTQNSTIMFHSPIFLQNIIQMCKNRIIVFDNTNKDMIKREEQLNELLSLVEFIIVDNGGKPYSKKTFAEHKVCHLFVSYFIIGSCDR